jgi:hypothetical protein
MLTMRWLDGDAQAGFRAQLSFIVCHFVCCRAVSAVVAPSSFMLQRHADLTQDWLSKLEDFAGVSVPIPRPVDANGQVPNFQHYRPSCLLRYCHS